MIYFVHSNMVFEKKSSTELAALELLDRVLGQMDKHKIPINFLIVDISVCHHRCIILTLCTYPTCYVYSE